MRVTKSYSIDRAIDAYLRKTSRGRRSVSERVNELLQRAIEMEEERGLEIEAERFYGSVTAEDRAETKAFQAAAKTPLAKD